MTLVGFLPAPANAGFVPPDTFFVRDSTLPSTSLTLARGATTATFFELRAHSLASIQWHAAGDGDIC